MRKEKSKASYTNKWLNRNKHLWYEEEKCERPITFKPNACVPNIVKERVKKINDARLNKLFASFYED